MIKKTQTTTTILIFSMTLNDSKTGGKREKINKRKRDTQNSLEEPPDREKRHHWLVQCPIFLLGRFVSCSNVTYTKAVAKGLLSRKSNGRTETSPLIVIITQRQLNTVGSRTQNRLLSSTVVIYKTEVLLNIFVLGNMPLFLAHNY